MYILLCSVPALLDAPGPHLLCGLPDDHKVFFFLLQPSILLLKGPSHGFC
jgi:hypothetical protein